MEPVKHRAEHRRHFSLRRTWIMALVIFAHGMLVLYLLAPAPPWKLATRSRSRSHAHGRGLILVFLKGRSHAASRHRSPPPAMHMVRHGVKRLSGRRTPREAPNARQHPTPAARVRSNPLKLSLPATDNDVPAYIAGGRAFRHRLQAAIRRNRRRLLPDNTVPGAPHFAMRDPGMHGLAHLMRSIFGARDPDCVKAGTELAMSKKQRAARYIDRAQAQQTVDHLHCEIRKSSWLAPAGPATHPDVRPPGHGTPASGYGIN